MKAWLIGGLAAIFFPGMSAGSVKAERMQIVFGVTEYIPLAPSRTRAADYVANADIVVPSVIRRCRGTKVKYRSATDGGAAVGFSASRPVETKRCIQQALPQVIFTQPGEP